MKKSTTSAARGKSSEQRDANTHNSSHDGHTHKTPRAAATHETSAAHSARKGVTSAKRIPGHPVRKVDARSLHRILTWSIELSRRQQQLMDAAIEIITNAKKN